MTEQLLRIFTAWTHLWMQEIPSPSFKDVYKSRNALHYINRWVM